MEYNRFKEWLKKEVAEKLQVIIAKAKEELRTAPK
jgi:hypothetical protein